MWFTLNIHTLIQIHHASATAMWLYSDQRWPYGDNQFSSFKFESQWVLQSSRPCARCWFTNDRAMCVLSFLNINHSKLNHTCSGCLSKDRYEHNKAFWTVWPSTKVKSQWNTPKIHNLYHSRAIFSVTNRVSATYEWLKLANGHICCKENIFESISISRANY